jgi:tripartite-type tricarboxylate transporter receptor subunit TctC
MIVVHPTLPIRSVKDLIALAKTRPGALNYASGSIGGAPHLAVELFKAMAGVNIVHIPYKGTAGGVTDLMSGQVQLMISTVASLTPQVKSGRLRALAVTSAQPSALAPGLPTVAVSGLPGYESTSVYGMLTTGKSPQASVSRLNQEVVRVLNRPDVKEKMLANGLEVIASSQEELAATMKSDMAKWGKLIRDLGIRG